MKRKNIAAVILAASILTTSLGNIPAYLAADTNTLGTTQATRYTRVMEYLDRGLVAVAKNYSDETKGMYLSWRLLGTEDLATTTFDIYKNGVLLESDYDGTNYTDFTNVNGTDKESEYYVVKHGESITAADVQANKILVNEKQVS